MPTVIPRPKITFVLEDSGETRALAPAMAVLQKRHIPYAIVAHGTSASLVEDGPNTVKIPSTAPLLDTHDTLTSPLARALSAPLIVTGLVSPWQQHLSQWAHIARRTVLGYFDTVLWIGQQRRWEGFLPWLNGIIAPSQEIAQTLRKEAPTLPVAVGGQPAVEDFVQTVQKHRGTDATALKSALGLQPHEPITVLAGSYGDAYQAIFKDLCDHAQQIPGTLLLSLHPSQSGEWEKAQLESRGLEAKIKRLPKAISTAQAVALADCVLTPPSTVLLQAALASVPVALLHPPHPHLPSHGFHLSADQSKTIPTFHGVSEGLSWLQQQASAHQTGQAPQHPASTAPPPWRAMGVPQPAATEIADLLQGALAQIEPGPGPRMRPRGLPPTFSKGKTRKGLFWA